MKKLRSKDRCNCDQALMGIELLSKCIEYWQLPDTTLPDIDLFDDIVRYIEWSEEKEST